MNSELTLDDRVLSALRRILRSIDVHSRYLVERFNMTGPRLIAL